ncbi:hypothetical protein KIN20_034121 [Parelaphostrongylus tenuis]|uniref:Uncharacterized protein n=1 Tax=Parelaphostrongylus tenuis TaxID=148309 RepID=A0AAD5R9U2_PARTN|nr:hypothetical protein KIN20_034121 [Parelaphostrongylus tenuis]
MFVGCGLECLIVAQKNDYPSLFQSLRSRSGRSHTLRIRLLVEGLQRFAQSTLVTETEMRLHFNYLDKELLGEETAEV